MQKVSKKYLYKKFLFREVNLMIVVTTENIIGYKIKEVKGEVFGLVVRSRGLGGTVMAGLRSLVGGEIHEYTTMLEDARKQAIDRLVVNATAMGANAIIMMRFDSSEIGQTMSEVLAYGTAVIIEKE
jgi:uncharacterized protein YbjQ (UPF0145 family)